MIHLLPEIITEILYRLPVKSLLRFRCVCKPWCDQIDDPYFIKLHYNHSLKTNTNLSLILADNDDLFSVDFDSLDTAIKLNNPTEDGAGTLGSCNGLVALFHSHKDLALWNPSTRKYHIVPATPIEIPGGFSKSIAYGFGYDPVSDDYKLVRIVLYYCRDQNLNKSQVKVYSLKSNSWRRTRDFPYYHCYHLLGNGILANNTLHWMVSTKSERDSANLIVAFDLRVEEYFEVPQPDYMDNSSFMCVESLGGCLSVVCDYVEVRVDVWVMKEYGVKESSTKLFSVAQGEVTGGFIFLRPMAYSKTGDKVLLDQDNEKFVWYDLRRKRVEKIRIEGAPESFEVEMCVGSLVPLNGGQQAGGN